MNVNGRLIRYYIQRVKHYVPILPSTSILRK